MKKIKNLSRRIVCIISALVFSSFFCLLASAETLDENYWSIYNFPSSASINYIYGDSTNKYLKGEHSYKINMVNSSTFHTSSNGSAVSGTQAVMPFFYNSTKKCNQVNVRSGGLHNYLWGTTSFRFSDMGLNNCYYVGGRYFFDDASVNSSRFAKNPLLPITLGQDYCFTIKFSTGKKGLDSPTTNISFWVVLCEKNVNQDDDLWWDDYYCIPYEFGLTADQYFDYDGKQHEIVWNFSIEPSSDLEVGKQYYISSIMFSFGDFDSYWVDNNGTIGYYFYLYDFSFSDKREVDSVGAVTDTFNINNSSLQSFNESFTQQGTNTVLTWLSGIDFDFVPLRQGFGLFKDVFNGFFSLPFMTTVYNFALTCGAFAIIGGISIGVSSVIKAHRPKANSSRRGRK